MSSFEQQDGNVGFDPMDSEWNEVANMSSSDAEFELLMSLALDDRLSPEEAARFEALLAEAADGDTMEPGAGMNASTSGAESWMLWQDVDCLLKNAPHEQAPVGFSAAVMQEIAWQERRKRLWLGTFIGATAVLLWGTAFLAIFGMVAFFSANEAVWLGDLGQSLAYWWTTISGFVVSALRSAGAILSTAQARAAILIYVTLAVGMMGLWVFFLRRTTQIDGFEEEAAV